MRSVFTGTRPGPPRSWRPSARSGTASSGERPTLEDIAAEEGRAGEELTTLGEYFALREATFRLKQHRLAAGLTLDEVAERSGIDRAALSRLETGKNLNPTVGTLAKVAAAVGLALTFSLEAAKV